MSDWKPLAVTFDCWSTLLYEREPLDAHEARVQVVSEVASRHLTGLSEVDARRAYDLAWEKHWNCWIGGRASGAPEIAGWALSALGIQDADSVQILASALAYVALESEIVALDGAEETLACLQAAGVRRALVCDTGFSPGRVVRRILEREGLLDYLEVQIFSDEAGYPKPDPRVFIAALDALEVAPGHAMHVGDLRRTDVMGARAAGMRTARIRHHYDDLSDHPEADHVVESHHHLRTLLRL